jgi:hypothetical protein
LSAQTIQVFFDNATGASSDLYLTIVDKVNAYQVDASTGLVSLAPNPTDGFVTSYKLTGATPDLPTVGGVPYITLQATNDLGQEQSIVSGRFYVSSTADAVAMGTTGAPGTISPTASFTYDLVEFTLNGSDAPNSLNLDLSQIDQFGMPITVTLDPPDADFPNGAGVLSTLSRQDILDQFATYATEPAFSAYAGVVQSSPSRLLGPHHLIDQLTAAAAPNNIQEYAGSISGSTAVAGGYEATYTLTGTWAEPHQATPPLNTSLTTAFQARGQFLPAGTSVKAVSTTNQHEVTLFSTAAFSDATTSFLSFVVPPSTPLVTAFDTAIYDFFEAFATPIHIIATPGRIYEGKLRHDFAVPSINDTGANTTQYTVIEFAELGTFDDQTSTITPPLTAQKYQVFYPYFSTNSTASPNSNAFTPGGVPAPPKWWNPAYLSGGGQLNWLTSPSQMVFACDGVFADDVYQEQYFVTEKGDGNWHHSVLGDIENQMSSWLNRGVSPTTNLENRVGFLSGLNLIRVDLSQKASGTATTVTPHGTSGVGVSYLPSQLTAAIPSPPAGGWGVVWPTLTGTLKLADTAIQTFTVQLDVAANELKLQFSAPSGTPANQASYGYLQVNSAGDVTEIFMAMQSLIDLDQLTIDFAFDYGPATAEARYGTVSLLPAPSGWTDMPASASTAGIQTGMKMIAFSQFKTPMEVYQVDATAGTVTVYAPTGLQSFNTNVLQFADFYPVDAGGSPVGSWNAYSGFWHEGDRKNNVPAPTIAARSYAFPFDDDGGYSSDINLTWGSSSGQVGTVTVKLLPFGEPTPTIVAGDFNADGRTDIASRDLTSGLWTVAFTPASPTASPTTQSMATWSTATRWSDISVGDFDADGRDDIVGRTANGAWWWLHYDQSSSTFINTRMGMWSSDVAWSDVVVGDFDGDGLSDIAGRAPTGMWWMLHDTGGGNFQNIQLNRWSTAVTWSDIVVGNFDGAASGRDGIAGRTSTGTWWMLHYDSSSSSFENTKLTGWATTVDWSEVLAGNFDGNAGGRDSIAARNSNNAWWLLSYDNASSSFTSTKMSTWSTAVTWTNIVSDDFDGDGADDIAGRIQENGVWWVIGKQGGQFQNSKFSGAWPTTAQWQLAFAGLYDSAAVGPPRTAGILGRSSTGSWVRSLSNGSSFTAAAVTGYG